MFYIENAMPILVDERAEVQARRNFILLWHYTNPLM